MAALSFGDILKFDPFRAPQWRYIRAKGLATATPVQMPTMYDDSYVRELRAFLVEHKKQSGKSRPTVARTVTFRNLLMTQPALCFAHDIYVGNDGRTKEELEARILARQTDEQIADSLATMPEVVNTYEQMFFNVRDRLSSQGYILNRVVFYGMVEGELGLNHAVLTKLFGYLGGEHVLNAVISRGNLATDQPTDPAQVEKYFEDFYVHAVGRRAAEHINYLPINSFTGNDFMSLRTKLIEISKVPKTGQGDGLDTLSTAMQGLLQALPWCAGDARYAVLEQSGVRDYHQGGAEYRASELVQLAGGTAIANLESDEFSFAKAVEEPGVENKP